jgi:hypothetical protein
VSNGPLTGSDPAGLCDGGGVANWGLMARADAKIGEFFKTLTYALFPPAQLQPGTPTLAGAPLDPSGTGLGIERQRAVQAAGEGIDDFVLDQEGQALEQGTFAAAAAVGGGLPSAAGRGEDELIAYRYVSEGEADVIRSSRIVPNTTRTGELKAVFYSPVKYNSASEAEEALQIGRFNPGGPTASPTHVVKVSLRGVRLEYGGNVENGKGVEIITYERVRALRVMRLKG